MRIERVKLGKGLLWLSLDVKFTMVMFRYKGRERFHKGLVW